MNKYTNKYNKENDMKLRQLHSKKPKEYWKILNKIKNKKHVKGPDLQNSDNNNNEDENEDDIINNPNVNANENNNCLNC